MALSSQMDYTVYMVFLHELLYSVEVADVCLNERVVRLILNVLEVSQIAGISQLVEVDDVVFGILVDKKSDYVAANKSGTASNEYVACIHKIGMFGCGFGELCDVPGRSSRLMNLVEIFAIVKKPVGVFQPWVVAVFF